MTLTTLCIDYYPGRKAARSRKDFSPYTEAMKERDKWIEGNGVSLFFFSVKNVVLTMSKMNNPIIKAFSNNFAMISRNLERSHDRPIK